MPLIERSPGGLEEDELKVEPEACGEEDVVAQEQQVEPQGDEGLVHHGHHVVGEPEEMHRIVTSELLAQVFT